MNPRESNHRTYTEAELAGLFATYFGDKLSQTQLDSLVASVVQAHADRDARAEPSAERLDPARTDRRPAPAPTGGGAAARFFGGWALA